MIKGVLNKNLPQRHQVHKGYYSSCSLCLRGFFLIIVAFFLVIAGVALAQGVHISVRFKVIQAHYDPRFVDGKFYRRPIHPGFITQRFPVFKARVTKSKARFGKGLPTAQEYRKR